MTTPVAKNVAQYKDSCSFAVALAGQFLTLGAAGIAFIIGLVFAERDAPSSLPPWALKVALVFFALSILWGWMFLMNVIGEINQSNNYNVYGGAPQWLSILQIVCCLLPLTLLGICSFLAIRTPEKQSTPVAADDGWRRAGYGITRGISGLSLLRLERDAVSFLAVLDNKGANEPRLMRLTAGPGQSLQSKDLPWPGADAPEDLEALTRMPGDSTQFVAVTSAGRLYHLRATAETNSVDLLGETALLNAAETPRIEAFDLQHVGPHLIAIWAGRGDGPTAAVLCWGKFDPQQRNVQDVQKAEFRTPWPQQSTRHISDLRVDGNGNVLVVSTSDPGADGPFESAAYLAGTFRADDGGARFEPNQSLVRLRALDKHKVEALELLPGARGGLIFGSDDENHGGAILYEP